MNHMYMGMRGGGMSGGLMQLLANGSSQIQNPEKEYPSNIERKQKTKEQISIKSDIAEMKSDIAEMKNDIKELKNIINELVEMMKAVYDEDV
jgi:hypothetical protein